MAARRLYLCERCRLYLGAEQGLIVRYEYADRLETRAAQLGGTVDAIRKAVQRDIEARRKSR